MLAAVLWLGNISFTSVDNENHAEPVVDEGNIESEKIITSASCGSSLFLLFLMMSVRTRLQPISFCCSFLLSVGHLPFLSLIYKTLVDSIQFYS